MIYITCIAAVAAVIVAIICLIQIAAVKKASDTSSVEELLDRQIMETGIRISDTEQKVLETDKRVKETGQNLQNDIRESRQETLNFMQRQLTDTAMQNEQKLENIRLTMEERLKTMTEDNSRQLEKMRDTVDEKLQKTLEERISQSFKLVSDRLEQVYKGLGEMQNLASGVGDLKKVLSNVKNRGILGEIQLGSILSQILAPEQYEENVKTTSGSERVEFAVILPGDDEGTVYLPIDAKFPGDAYIHLMEAYDSGDKALIDAAGKNLETAVKKAAKDIHDKYIEPPATTDFGIMFLPFEGLYAEVVRRGLVESLQREYKVNIAGPTTMAALLNSLQMGFKTLAIQKRSGEVWNTLAAVKTEFGKFEKTLTKAQERINQANKELEHLVGTRTRMMNSKLKSVSTLDFDESREILGIEGPDDGEEQ